MRSSIYDINRKHKIDNTYFMSIDTSEKAYWLGFLWADGSLSKTTNRCTGNNRITVAQKESEINQLNKLNTSLKSDYKIIIKNSTGFKGFKMCTLHINSRPLCIQLENLGFGKKEERTKIPPIDKNVFSHFLRGYFDGDGSLALYAQIIKKWTINKQELSFTGHPLFIDNLKKEIHTHLPYLSDTKIKTYKSTKNAASLRYGKKSDVKSLYEFMYKDATIYLESKYHKFQLFQNK